MEKTQCTTGTITVTLWSRVCLLEVLFSPSLALSLESSSSIISLNRLLQTHPSFRHNYYHPSLFPITNHQFLLLPRPGEDHLWQWHDHHTVIMKRATETTLYLYMKIRTWDDSFHDDDDQWCIYVILICCFHLLPSIFIGGPRHRHDKNIYIHNTDVQFSLFIHTWKRAHLCPVCCFCRIKMQ